MVRIQKIELLSQFSPVGAGMVKSGGRIEYALPLDDSVFAVADQIDAGMPLRFASLIIAGDHGACDQEFHEDGTYNSTNAIIYLTDVPTAEHGAIEFQSVGPILGARGAAVIYGAGEIHRGRANHTTQERVALDLVFSNDERPIHTIGSSASVSASAGGYITLSSIAPADNGNYSVCSIDSTGNVSIPPGSNTLDPLGLGPGSYTLTAFPNNEYSFTGWAGDIVSTINPYNYIVPGPTIGPQMVANFVLTASLGVSCFLANAPVLTPGGYARIASLKEGDIVSGADGLEHIIQRVTVQRVKAGPAVNPYIIPKGLFGANKQLLISPNHKLLVDGRMIEASSHTLGLEQAFMSGDFDYYNLELDAWENMVVAGVTVESLAPIRRVVVSFKTFAAIIVKKYGAITPAVLATIKRTCRELPNNQVEIPIMPWVKKS